MAAVDEILSSVPESAGTYTEAAQALGQPLHEGHLGDPELNGEHVVAHVGLGDLLEGKLSDDLVRVANRAVEPSAAGMAGLGHVEKILGNHSGSVDSGVSKIFEQRLPKPEGEEPVVEAHKDLVEHLNNYASNAGALIDKLSDSTQALHAVAPQIAASAQQAAARAVQFLSSKAIQPDPEPLSDSHEPSKAEVSSFNRYLNIVESPTNALKEIKNGTLTPETIETLQTVYPRLYGEMKKSLISQMGPDTPYRTKMTISQFLGEPMDSSLTPQRIASLQSSFLPTSPQSSAGQPPQRKGRSLAQLDIASRVSLAPKDSE